MKNTINYYYQLNIENLHFISGTYYFTYLNNNYKLVEYNKNPDYINSLVYLNKRNIMNNKFFHEIIFTRDKNPFIIIDNHCYFLIKLSSVINDKISFYDIFRDRIDVTPDIKSLYRFNWNILWSMKNDNLDEVIKHSESKYLDILPVINFFIGLTENAISYYNNTVKNKNVNEPDYFTVCHTRININTSVTDLYNPLDLIIDHRSRDFAEYIKGLFINNNYDYKEIEEYIFSLNFSNYEFSIFYSRLLYPTFFFDLCDLLFNGKIDKREFYKLEERIDEYTTFLKEIYFIIRKKSNIEPVNWIIKK